MDSLDRIERKAVFPTERERVWATLTAPEHFARWFHLSFAAPNPAEVMFLEGQTVASGVIEVVDPPREFAFLWQPDLKEEAATLVTITLEAVEYGTELTLVESGFTALPDDMRRAAWVQHSDGWDEGLQRLLTNLTDA